MNRRSFIGKLFKTIAVAAIAPDIVTAVDKFATTPKIISIRVNGIEYWVDYQMFQAQQKFLLGQEQLIWKLHRPFRYDKDELR